MFVCVQYCGGLGQARVVASCYHVVMTFVYMYLGSKLYQAVVSLIHGPFLTPVTQDPRVASCYHIDRYILYSEDVFVCL